MKTNWKHTELTPDELLSLRYNRAVAYKAGQYKMQPPPVCTTRWDEEAWMNWVKFDNETLTGFLPYTERPAGSGTSQN
jgi:hypothetical protein